MCSVLPYGFPISVIINSLLFQMRTGVVDEILDEQDRQAGILIKQSEILALNTVLVRALVEQVRSGRETAKDEVTLRLEELPQ